MNRPSVADGAADPDGSRTTQVDHLVEREGLEPSTPAL
jgi:hypothetical protein